MVGGNDGLSVDSNNNKSKDNDGEQSLHATTVMDSTEDTYM